MSLVTRNQKGKIDRLKRQLENYESKYNDLVEENSELRSRIEFYEGMMDDVRKMESDCNERIEELKALKDKYKKVISEAYEMKMRYSREMKSLIKQFSKEF